MLDREKTLSFNEKNIKEFRDNGGKLGGMFEGAPVLLLTTIGKKSGLPRTSPMMSLSLDGDDRIFVFASNEGRDNHPNWYFNVLADPEVEVEIGTDKFKSVDTPLEGDERDRVWNIQAGLYDGFRGYQERTSRVIPVVALARI